MTGAIHERLTQYNDLKREILLDPVNPDAYINLADFYWSNYSFEASARTCLSCLHLRPYPSGSCLSESASFSNLKVVLSCGGRGARWGDFMGISKQLVDCGDGVPLIQRTLNQFSKRLSGARFYILIGEDQGKDFVRIKGCQQLIRHHSSGSHLCIEVFGCQVSGELRDSDILLLHGDVYFSDDALDRIEECCIGLGGVKSFGRKNANSKYRNNYGEVFGWFVRKEMVSQIFDWSRLAADLYIGSPLFRQSAWEVISLMSWARKQGIESADVFRRTGISPIDACMGVLKTFERKDFDESLWVDIDDYTEDFDFPIEYLTRLRLLVERMRSN